MSTTNKGRTGAVRQKALSWADLANMERHGKREDESGQRRRVREAEPLVAGSLDVRECRAAHMEGVRQSGNTAALHMLIQYPTGLIDGKAEDQQQRMLDHAMRFANKFHGGDAVFAARLDRDEKGRHSVDVFAMPRYDFHYKDGRIAKKAAVSKFTKAEAEKRFNRQDRRAQGSALQDAWFEYMRDEMGLDVLPPQRKKATAKDRVEPEEYALAQERAKQRDQKAEQDRLFLDRYRALKGQKQALKDDRAALEADRAKLDKERSAAETLSRDAQAALAAARQATEGLGKPEAAQALAQRQKALRGRRAPEIGD